VHVGADVGWRLARHAGLGGLVRFSKATVSLTVPNDMCPVSSDAGGFLAAGGLGLYC